MQTIQKTVEILLQDVRVVPRERMQIGFHLNTKLARIASMIEFARIENKDELWNRWQSLTAEFVSCLPRGDVACGESGKLKDPFGGARNAFRTNRKGDKSEIVQKIILMEEVVAAARNTKQEHLNLAEILLEMGHVEEEALRDLNLLWFGTRKTTEEQNQDFLDQMTGSAMLGECSKTEFDGGVIFNSNGGQAEHQEGGFLAVKGFYGRIVRFPVILGEGYVIVVNPANSSDTSVTNLAEAVFQEAKLQYGAEVRVFESYEEQMLNGYPVFVDEITLDEKGVACWRRFDRARRASPFL